MFIVFLLLASLYNVFRCIVIQFDCLFSRTPNGLRNIKQYFVIGGDGTQAGTEMAAADQHSNIPGPSMDESGVEYNKTRISVYFGWFPATPFATDHCRSISKSECVLLQFEPACILEENLCAYDIEIVPLNLIDILGMCLQAGSSPPTWHSCANKSHFSGIPMMQKQPV